MPGSASYSQRIAIVGPSPVSMVPRNAVATPATPRSTVKPCLSRNSASHAAALTSWYASSGLSWICRDSFSRSSARRSTACGTRSLTPLMMGLPEVSARPRGAAESHYTPGPGVENRARRAATAAYERSGDLAARRGRRWTWSSADWAARWGRRWSAWSADWAARWDRRPSPWSADSAARWGHRWSPWSADSAVTFDHRWIQSSADWAVSWDRRSTLSFSAAAVASWPGSPARASSPPGSFRRAASGRPCRDNQQGRRQRNGSVDFRGKLFPCRGMTLPKSASLRAGLLARRLRQYLD